MKKFPIAERFTSLQGEGLYTGTLMHFIRFGGCSVGKKASPQQLAPLLVSEADPLPIYREKCTTYDGREFICDTDFRTRDSLTMEEILKGVPKNVEHLCFTGGEPMNHKLHEFFEFIGSQTDYKVHIETSGTVSMTEWCWEDYDESDSIQDREVDSGGWMWITVSPKKGVLPEMIGLANEIKLLVDKHFDVKKVPRDILDHRLVWVQPVNEEWVVNDENVQRCIQLVNEHPNWRLSMQMHKIWKVR